MEFKFPSNTRKTWLLYFYQEINTWIYKKCRFYAFVICINDINVPERKVQGFYHFHNPSLVDMLMV